MNTKKPMKVTEYFSNNSNLKEIATEIHETLDKHIQDTPGLQRKVDFHSGTPEEGRIIPRGYIRTGIIGQEQELLTLYNGKDYSITVFLPENLHEIFYKIVQTRRN